MWTKNNVLALETLRLPDAADTALERRREVASAARAR
jgi:hypothetical protein